MSYYRIGQKGPYCESIMEDDGLHKKASNAEETHTLRRNCPCSSELKSHIV